MRFEAYDINLVEAKGYKRSHNVRLLNEFVNSGLACATVEDFEHRDANVCACSLRKTVLRERLYSIKVIVRKGKVYLINEIIANKKRPNSLQRLGVAIQQPLFVLLYAKFTDCIMRIKYLILRRLLQ